MKTDWLNGWVLRDLDDQHLTNCIPYRPELSSLTSDDIASVTESAATRRVFLMPHTAFNWLPVAPMTSVAPAVAAAVGGWNACIMLLPMVASWSRCWRPLLTAGRTAELRDPMRGLDCGCGEFAFCKHVCIYVMYQNSIRGGGVTWWWVLWWGKVVGFEMTFEGVKRWWESWDSDNSKNNSRNMIPFQICRSAEEKAQRPKPFFILETCKTWKHHVFHILFNSRLQCFDTVGRASSLKNFCYHTLSDNATLFSVSWQDRAWLTCGYKGHLVLWVCSGQGWLQTENCLVFNVMH